MKIKNWFDLKRFQKELLFLFCHISYLRRLPLSYTIAVKMFVFSAMISFDFSFFNKKYGFEHSLIIYINEKNKAEGFMC